jgi:Mg-chelatase subunit ChlD
MKPPCRPGPVVAALLAAVLGLGLGVDGTRGASGGYRLVDQWPDADALSTPGYLDDPAGIDVTADGTVAVVDRGNHRVQLFTAEGRFLTAYGSSGPDPGELRAPQDVALTEDRVIVTDPAAARIVVFSREGLAPLTWPGLVEPWGVAAGPGGAVYVTDRLRGEIVVFDTTGTRVATLGREGFRDGQLHLPQGIDVAPDGTVVVADTGNGRLQLFNSAGRSLDAFTPEDRNRALMAPPWDVATDAGRNIFMISANGLVWFGRDATRRYEIEAYYPEMTAAAGVAVEPAAGVFVVRSHQASWLAEVARYAYLSRNGRPLARFGAYGGTDQLVGVRAVRLAPSGELGIVSATGAGIFAPDGRSSRRLPVAGDVVELAFLPTGDVLAATAQTVVRLAADGTPQWVWPDLAAPVKSDYPLATSWFSALVYDPQADLIYLVDIGNNTLVHLRPDGTPAGQWPIGPPEALIAYRDLDLSPAGELVLVNQTSRQVEFRRPSWELARTLAPPGIPTRVALAGQTVFVLTRDGWVWRYGPDLQLETVWNAGDGRLALDVAATADQVVTVHRQGVLIWAFDPDGTPGPPPTAPQAVHCTVTVGKTARPELVLLGESVEVTLTLGGTCPAVPPQADIVLVFDRSGSMQLDNKIAAAQRAALDFLDAVDFSQARVGLVSFNQTPLLDQPLTDDRAALAAAVERLTAIGGTDIAAAVEEASLELAGPRRRPTAQGVLVLLTDGNSEVRGALLAALEARLDGTRLFTIGLGADVNTFLLQRMASTPQDYYFAPGNAELTTIYADIARRLQAEVLARQLLVTDVLPANMELQQMLAGPAPAIDGRRLTWSFSDVGFDTLRLAYRLRPAEPGSWPTNVSAEARYLDGFGQAGGAVFPVPWVTVLRPALLPTPPPVTPTPPVVTVHRLYLPITQRLPCVPAARRADVVLVVDASSSMLEPTRGGRTKLAAAQQAAALFVDLLELPADQAAVVGFNHSAWLAQGLGTDAGRLHQALEMLAVEAGTRIDLGLAAGQAELESDRRRAASRPVLVLLTDGRPTGTTGEAVRLAAAAARAASTELFAIGLGDDVDPALLADVATDPAHLYFAPDGDDLERIYRLIAGAIPCADDPASP